MKITDCNTYRLPYSENILLTDCKLLSLLFSPCHFLSKFQPIVYDFDRPIIQHVKNSTQKGMSMEVYEAEFVEEVLDKAREEDQTVINGGAPTV